MESVLRYKDTSVNLITDKEYRWWDTGVGKLVPVMISYLFQDTSTLFDVIKFIRNDKKIPLFAQVFLQKYKPTDILKNI